ncbi:MAG: nickel-type superoxide dismutase maturation protease [Candidatus Nanopelagicales bacterium]
MVRGANRCESIRYLPRSVLRLAGSSAPPTVLIVGTSDSFDSRQRRQYRDEITKRREAVVRLPSPLTRVAVAGDSMRPTLHPGDWLVVAHKMPIRVGRIVVAQRPDRPDLLVIKRAQHQADDGAWWLEGDNPHASDDSRTFGVVPNTLIRGVVVARYWPTPRLL